MQDRERYMLRPVALCCVLTAGGVLLLLLGLRLFMAIRGVRMILGLVLLIVSGLLFVGVYLLGRCAVIMDAERLRIRGFAGDWRQMRWTEAAAVTRRYVPQHGRSGGCAMLVVTTRAGERFEVLQNDRTLMLLQKYCPVSIDGAGRE